MINENAVINVKQVILEALEYRFCKEISDYYPTEINIREDFTDLGKSMYLELRQYIWAEKLQETKQKVEFTVRYPSTWWQHFKQANFPRWLLKKYPVKEKTVYKSETINFERIALFPEFRYHSKKSVERFVIHESISFKPESIEY